VFILWLERCGRMDRWIDGQMPKADAGGWLHRIDRFAHSHLVWVEDEVGE
jgi:hypothetical protein